MYVKFSGRLLERLYQLCGGNILLSLEANLVHSPGGRSFGQHTVKLTTTEMGIFPPSTMLSGSQQLESGTLEGCLNQEMFCEDILAKLSYSLVDATDSDTLNGSFAIILKIEDEYINFDGILFDQMSACKSIFRNGVHSDICIVAADGSLIPSHKCFLSTHSSVLKVMLLQENFEEAKTNKIKMDDVSKDCVMALLEFLYAWEITAALRSSELAVELFQVAHKCDIKPLEYKLANMFLKRENQWFAVDASIELFCFARKIEADSAELKVKAVQALKSNSEGLLNSKTFKTLFTQDPETAMELCTMSLQSR